MSRFPLDHAVSAGRVNRCIVGLRRHAWRGLCASLFGILAAGAVSATSGDTEAGDLPTPRILEFDPDAAAPEVPSGQEITRLELLLEYHDDESWLILRYLAPQIVRGGGGFDYAAAARDLDHLCATDGRTLAERQEQEGEPVDQIVVTMLERAIERGTADPDSAQFNEAYRLVNGACEAELF